MIKKICISLIGAGLLLVSCKHEPLILPVVPTDPGTTGTTGNNGNGNGNGNGGNNGNTSTCSPDTVYFQNDILPLFVSNCAITGCHDAATHREGKVYDTYANIIGTGHIQPFSLTGSTYRSITTSDPGDRMPPSPHPPLTSSQVSLIATWINQGALDNVCNSGTCDTSNVTYAGIIAPLFQSRCNGCHNSSSPGGNINLTTYAGVQAVALNGHLFGTVNHDTGFSAMPKNTTKLPDCEIAQIRIWIQNGALNN